MNIFTFFNTLFNYITQIPDDNQNINDITNNNNITNNDDVVDISCNIMNINKICSSDIEINVIDEIKQENYNTQYNNNSNNVDTNSYELETFLNKSYHYDVDNNEEQIFQRHHTQFFKGR